MVEYIILTGGTGFLGSKIVSQILRTTNFGLILPSKNFSKFNRFDLDYSRVKIIEVENLVKQCENLETKIIGAIHSATEYGREGNQIEAVLAANIALPVKILQIISKQNAGFFINAESFFNKFPSSYPHLGDYSNSKRSLHYWLAGQSRNICIVNLFLEHLYGPGDSIEKFVPKLLSDLRSQRTSPILLSKGDQERDFVFVEDAADAFVKAIYFSISNAPGIYNFEIGTGIATTIKDFALQLKTFSASENEIKFGALPYRKDEIMSSFANVKNNVKLDWESRISLEAGITRLVEHEKF